MLIEKFKTYMYHHIIISKILEDSNKIKYLQMFNTKVTVIKLVNFSHMIVEHTESTEWSIITDLAVVGK